MLQSKCIGLAAAAVAAAGNTLPTSWVPVTDEGLVWRALDEGAHRVKNLEALSS
jgi:hypothetical protein